MYEDRDLESFASGTIQTSFEKVSSIHRGQEIELQSLGFIILGIGAMTNFK